jgi:hypothetical protein
MIVLCFGAYLIAHFALYAALLRRGRLTATERGVFLYHFIPAAAWVTGLTALALAVPWIGVADVVLVGSLHGIYSLSFLELWALADGGYSLAILESIESGHDLRDMERLGATKNQGRLADLERMGLVQSTAAGPRLTVAGRVAAAFIALVVWLAGMPMSD